MSSFIASFLGGGGVGQKFRPLRSKSVSELVNVLDERFTIRLLKMTSLLIMLTFLFFRCASILVRFRSKSLCPAGCGFSVKFVSFYSLGRPLGVGPSFEKTLTSWCVSPPFLIILCSTFACWLEAGSVA